MSHALYHVDAFVVGVRDAGEANRVISLFSRELGLVKASAQGVRELRSKLRYALALFSHSRVSLVRGREVWRVTGALSLEGPYSEMWRSEVMSRFFLLITRFVQGEESDPELYEELLYLRDAVGSARESDARELELLGVVRILSHLGYGATGSEVEYVCGAPVSSLELVRFVREHYAGLLAGVNAALSHSQL